MVLIHVILNGCWHSNSQIDVGFSREYDGIIRFPCQHLDLPLLVKNIGAQKSDEDIFVNRPFLNRKHAENGHLAPFPYINRGIMIIYHVSALVICKIYITRVSQKLWFLQITSADTW